METRNVFVAWLPSGHQQIITDLRMSFENNFIKWKKLKPNIENLS